LTSGDPEAFGVFYARHLPGVEAYFAHRIGREAAAELAAETFASALVARRRFVPGNTPAIGWLHTIAARRLVDFRRRGFVRQRTLEALASEATTHDPPCEYSAIAAELDPGVLRHLPRAQRDAIVARVLHERDYGQIALASGTSQASVRQRVSRGLSALRGPLQVYRAAQALARQDRGLQVRRRALQGPVVDRTVRTAGLLSSGQPEPASSGPARARTRLGLGQARRSLERARRRPLRHRLANEEHVWIEFNLDSDHGERFGPTPSRLAPNNGWMPSKEGPTRDFIPRHWPGL
jgi:RNA polymerase sigma-70 factor (ECF subfamily)